ncbi:MAG: hypothetical protein LKJ25_04210 [Clostridia bacterium]|jgi:hypothetical protein|nr:hypothetical protein [Clostridia bacterium]
MKNKEKILNALTDLIVRASKNENATPEEWKALTEVAYIALSYCDNFVPEDSVRGKHINNQSTVKNIN